MHMPGGGQEGVRRVSGGGQEGVYLIRMRIAQHVQSKTDVWILAPRNAAASVVLSKWSASNSAPSHTAVPVLRTFVPSAASRRASPRTVRTCNVT
eukprot:1190138-Prorocentrum_minimum.AAC.3